jgi:hypothetical protein
LKDSLYQPSPLRLPPPQFTALPLEVPTITVSLVARSKNIFPSTIHCACYGKI